MLAAASAREEFTLAAEATLTEFLGSKPNLPAAVVSQKHAQIQRLHDLSQIKRGNLPRINGSGVVARKGEWFHWSCLSTLLEEHVTGRKYLGASQGVSIHVARGVTFHTGGQRGHAVNETGLVVVAHGELFITSQRLIFAGDLKSFDLKFEKIVNLQIFSNGLNVGVPTGKAKRVRFDQAVDGEMMGAILSSAINHAQ